MNTRRLEDERYKHTHELRTKSFDKWMRRGFQALGALAGVSFAFALSSLAVDTNEHHSDAAGQPAEPPTPGQPVTSGTNPDAGTPAPSIDNHPDTTPAPETPSAPPAAELPPATPPAPALEPNPTPSPVTTEQLSHVVHKGEGLSHALRGQDSARTIQHELTDTKVMLNGHEVSLNDTGVREAGTVSAVIHDVGGHKTIDLYDAHDGHQITGSEMDKYLYILNDGTHGTGDHVSGHDISVAHGDDVGEGSIHETANPIEGKVSADSVPPVESLFRNPLPTDTESGYVQSGLQNYVETHPEWSALSHLSPEQLTQRPELSIIRDQLKREYLQHLGSTPTEAGDGGAGGAVDLAATEGSKSTSLDGLVNTESHRLTEAGVRELGLQEHISGTGEIQDYKSFSKEVLALLQSDHRDRITGPNGLVFEDRGGVLYVDVAGGAQEHFPLDEKLYHELMVEYKTHVDSALDGKFDKESFYDVLDRAETHHALRTFEQPDWTLNFLNEGKSYAAFQDEIRHIMDIHDTNQFRTANGLTFIQEGDQLFVRATISKYEVTADLYVALMKHYDKLLISPDYRGVFDGEQLAKVVEDSK